MTPGKLEARGHAVGPEVENDELPEMVGPAVTDAEAEESARAAGMSLVNLNRVKHYRRIGRYLTKQGLIMLKRGKLAGRAESLERARERLLELMGSDFYDDSDSEVGKSVAETTGRMAVALAGAIAIVAKVENEADELDLKLEKLARDDAPKPASTNRAPPPGAAVQLTGTLELKPPPLKPIVVPSDTV